MTSLNELIGMTIKDDINYFEYDEFSNVEKFDDGALGIVNKADWKSCKIRIALKFLVNDLSINEDNMDKFVKEVLLNIIINLTNMLQIISLYQLFS